MNAHALAVLEFAAVLRAVAARAGSEEGRAALLALRPGTEPETLRRELARVSETLSLLADHPDWDPPLPPTARAALRTLDVDGGVPDPARLLTLGRLLRAARELGEALDERAGGPHLGKLRVLLPALPDEEARIEAIVDDEGEVRDGASPSLRQIRRRLAGARARVVRRLDAFAADLPDRIRVPGASVSVREGRYVVAIRREGRGEVGGIVHGESATGATLFVEPPLAIELMNELQELEREEQIEIQRILRDAAGRLRPHREALRAGLDALVDFDTLAARARTALAWDASPPELLDPDAEDFRVVGGRHPLLVESAPDLVVPFDLELAPGERALVVSGPNTGGKTVLLKALGLLPLLAQAGVMPPARPGTRLPIFRDVFADIGDEQSIAESLSTFSAHLANAREILDEAGPHTLVLMDEMGTGTDPAEGAALARAVLETLVERGARAVVTSHLGALKRLDGEVSGVVNASLLFDPDRIEPTFRLRKGRPGRSFGLAIARRLGLPAEVLDRAEDLVESGELDVERLLETLERKERELSEALAQATAARDEAARLRDEVRSRGRALSERERAAEASAREEARRLLLEAREEVEAAIREVRGADVEGRDEAERAARARVESAAREQTRRNPASGRALRPRRGGPAVAEGDRVRIRDGGARGIVRERREDRITVEVGGLRVQLPVSDVEPVEGGSGTGSARGGQGAAGGRGEAGSSRTGPPAKFPEVEVEFETDLRGLRVDEVDLALGRALDGAVLGDLGELRIIHGKGTGAVKARVRELLSGDRRVRGFREGSPSEGGGGVTVALLR